jgi:hypothetical protein
MLNAHIHNSTNITYTYALHIYVCIANNFCQTDFLSWLDVFNFNLPYTLPIGCMVRVTFYIKLLVTTLTPLVLVAILACTYAVSCSKNKVTEVARASTTNLYARNDRLQQIFAKHVNALLVLTFLVYTTASVAVLQTFPCDSIAGTGKSYLRADYSLECGTTQHTIYRVYAALMILVYPLGIPALYAALLWRHRDAVRATATATRPRIDRMNANSALMSSAFLWQPYTVRMYYWQVVECLRRLLLTGVLVFFMWSTTATEAAIGCLLAVQLVLAAVVLICAPHRDSWDQCAYILGASVIFLTMLMALLIESGASKFDDTGMIAYGALMIVLCVALLLFAVLQMAIAERRRYLLKRESSIVSKAAKSGPHAAVINGRDDTDTEAPISTTDNAV